jgi:hypothetical protein
MRERSNINIYLAVCFLVQHNLRGCTKRRSSQIRRVACLQKLCINTYQPSLRVCCSISQYTLGYCLSYLHTPKKKTQGSQWNSNRVPTGLIPVYPARMKLGSWSHHRSMAYIFIVLYSVSLKTTTNSIHQPLSTLVFANRPRSCDHIIKDTSSDNTYPLIAVV